MKATVISVCLLLFSVGLSAQKKIIKSLQRPLITGIAKAAFFTKAKVINTKFYSKYLGFTQTETNLSVSSFVKINSNQFVELIPEKKSGGNRLSHFAVETNNAEAMRTYLLAKKITVPATSKDHNGNTFFFITDPIGTICEFIQFKKKAVTKNDLPDSAIARRMSHVGFMVADVDKAIAFYCGILGFTETWRGSKDGKYVTWVNLQVPDGKDYIELMLYDKEQSEENMGVLNHVCLEVTDVTVAAQILSNRPLLQGCKQTTAIKTGINKKRQINCFDIDGTRVEIMEAQTIDGQSAPSSTAQPLKFIANQQL